MQNYVKSFCRVHGGRILCLALCALVVPVSRAAIYQSGDSPGDSIIWIPLDDPSGCGKPITLHYSIWVYFSEGVPNEEGNPVAQSLNQTWVISSAGVNNDGGFQIMDVGHLDKSLNCYSRYPNPTSFLYTTIEPRYHPRQAR